MNKLNARVVFNIDDFDIRSVPDKSILTDLEDKQAKYT